MANEKTKALTEKVKELHEKHIEEMRSLESEREQALKEEMFDDNAVMTFNLYQSYIKAGFTEEQAWELVVLNINNAKK